VEAITTVGAKGKEKEKEKERGKVAMAEATTIMGAIPITMVEAITIIGIGGTKTNRSTTCVEPALPP
jgi:hypothetical protein